LIDRVVRIGMIIAERYEILEKIGTGGMSDVYKAKDHKLNRHVAVKILKQEFSENANFVSKFRVEAQAAAGLMHPNIVNVYDVGQEDGVYYIVMELVEGITLKKYIEKKARLSFKEAVSIAIQVSMGIEAAHNNHIIHRDIKPQNIIISKEGKVKVTDFGIAKAATSNTITSNVMGSVHYTSPEQARGGYSDEKSDIYSLGITLFEMLTGRVPFNGETTVAIAIKHIQENMPSPKDFVSEIPVSIEEVVFKCCQKSPDRRYQTMGELIKDLKYALMNPDESFVNLDSHDEIGATKAVQDSDLSRIKRQTRVRQYNDQYQEQYPNQYQEQYPNQYQDQYGNQYDDQYDNQYDNQYDDGYDDGYYDEYQDGYSDDYYDNYDDSRRNRNKNKDKKIEKITTIIAIAAAVVIGLVILFIIFNKLDIFGSSDEETDEIATEANMVEFDIDVIGRDADSVKKELIEKGFTPELEYDVSSSEPEGVVIRCSVSKGEMIAEGSNIVLTINVGEKGVEVPNIVGKSAAEATAILREKGFDVQTEEGFDDYIQVGYVFKQTPEGNAKALSGAAITIYISQGPDVSQVEMPNLVGMDEAAVIITLQELGLEIGEVTQVDTDDSTLDGLISEQSVEAGTKVEVGTKIDYSVAIGPSTYKFTEFIAGPTQEEDPAFVPGTNVVVTLIAEDGTVLMSTQVNSFPMPQQNSLGIKSATGTLILQYVNHKEDSTYTNEDGSVTIIPGGDESKEIRRTIIFTPE